MEKNEPKNGFKSPENYFEDFEDRLFNKLSEDKLPKESGFKVPEGYFDQLDQSLILNAKNSEKKTKGII